MSTIREMADLLTELDGLDRSDRYTQMMRVAKVVEEAGEACAALIAYHDVNPRKEAGLLEHVIDELCDVAITALVSIENFGVDSREAMAKRLAGVSNRLGV